MSARRPRRGRPFVLCCALLAAAAAGQATLNVPGAFPDVQSAIAAAAPGDTVLVGPGTWSGPIDFLGKDVRVVASAGVATTFLDGGDATSVVRFQSGETPAALLEGFTLKNGLSALGTPGGGGIYCVNASPTIRDCAIKDCRARDGSPTTNWTAAHGGGAYVSGGAPRFERCRFENNRAGDGARSDWNHPDDPFVGWPGGHGGGVAVYGGSGTRFSDCAFVGNRAGTGGDGEPAAGGGSGGGIGGSCPSWTIERCTFDANFAGTGGSGDQGWGAGGGSGGALNVSGQLLVSDCRIVGNWGGSSGSGGSGAGTGGLDVYGDVVVRDTVVSGNGGGGAMFGMPGIGGMVAVGPVRIERCEIRGNGGGAAGGLFAGPSWPSTGVPTVVDSLIVGNFGTDEGFGQYGPPYPGAGGFAGAATLFCCTIAGNGGGYSATVPSIGGLHAKAGTALRNCVVFDNVGLPIETDPPGGVVAVDYGCIEGGYPGVGNIATPPGFANAAASDYRLTAGSPCVDAGDPAVVPAAGAPSDLCLDGTPRLLDGNLDGVMRVDMGAHEFAHGRLTPSKSTASNGDTLVSVALDGTVGLFAFLAAGAPFDAWLPPYGPLLLDPATAFVLPLGPLPVVVPTYVVPAASAGWTIDAQALVFDGAGRGNFTNRATIPLP